MAWSWIWGFVWLALFFLVGVTSAFVFHTAVPATIAFLLFFLAGLFVRLAAGFCVVLGVSTSFSSAADRSTQKPLDPTVVAV
jgi:hypothetical protein